MKDRIQELDYYWNYSVKKNEPLRDNITPFVLHYNTITTNLDKLKSTVLYKNLIGIAKECKIKDYLNSSHIK
jgi:hypothetical protein